GRRVQSAPPAVGASARRRGRRRRHFAMIYVLHKAVRRRWANGGEVTSINNNACPTSGVVKYVVVN
ncbi:hypothetical protein LSAT2_010411, partial [Lamellibrachia satsuma]